MLEVIDAAKSTCDDEDDDEQQARLKHTLRQFFLALIAIWLEVCLSNL